MTAPWPRSLLPAGGVWLFGAAILVIAPIKAPAAAPAADAGHAVYEAKCGICHGANAEGGDHGPPLHDPDFWDQWADGPARKLYSRIISTMPADDPGSVPPAEVVRIVDYLARLNSGTSVGAAATADALDSVTLASFRE